MSEEKRKPIRSRSKSSKQSVRSPSQMTIGRPHDSRKPYKQSYASTHSLGVDLVKKPSQVSPMSLKKKSTHISSGRVPSRHDIHQQEKKSLIPSINDDVETSLLQIITDLNTLDIWLHKKGGDFDIFDGKLLVHPGNFNPKKDFITIKKITASDRHRHIPDLSKFEKINSHIYDFSTNKKQLKQAVQVWLPCQPVTHPHLQEVKLKAKFADDEEWVNYDWQLFGDDPQQPMIEFTTDRLGTFVATVQPRVEKFTVTNQGLLYNAKLNHYISIRFPKKCIEKDTNINIKIIPFNMEKAMLVREEFRYSYPNLSDFELATDYYEVLADNNEPFKRSVSLKLPTSNDGFSEEHRDDIVIMRKGIETGQWNIVESNLKITRTTVSFDSKLFGSSTSTTERQSIFSIQFDTKHLGRFIMLKAPAKRKMRMKGALPVLETKMTLCRREVLIFKKMLKKSWNIWVEVVRPSEVQSVINKRQDDGLICIGRPDNISVDLDGKLELSSPVPHHKQPNNHEEHKENVIVEQTDSELQFAKDLTSPPSTTTFINIYDVDSEESLQPEMVTLVAPSRKTSKKKSLAKKEYNYIEIEDCANAGFVTITGGVRQVDEIQHSLFFLENQPENFMTFEIEPTSTETDSELDVTVQFFTETTNATDGLTMKTLVKECKFTVCAEQVQDYFWVEPEPEPIVEAQEEKEPAPTTDTLKPLHGVGKSQVEKSRDVLETVRRLSAPVRPKQLIYREPRVLSGRSLQTLSRLIEEGLTLAVYLDMPDSTITGIGFDALSNGLSLADVTYRILLRWKRSTKVRGDSAVEELANALRGMGRHDIVSVIWEAHHKNMELAPASFAHLHLDDDHDNDNNHYRQQSHHNNRVSVQQFQF